MAVKKMFPSQALGKTYDEVNLRIGFSILARQIVMRFSDQVEWVRMSSGARSRPSHFDG
jgi:hypothetical protein